MVDVVVSAPAASASATSVAALTTAKVAVAAEPSASEFLIGDDPRRVLRPPIPLPLATASLPQQTAGPLQNPARAMLTPTLAQRTATDAPNMTAEGPPSGGAFKQGDTLHLQVTMQPGRCYTVIAVSNTITELDIELMIAPAAGMPFPPMAVAKDATAGPTAVVGPGSNCFKNPMPVAFPAVAVVRATTGAGAALAQAFSR